MIIARATCPRRSRPRAREFENPSERERDGNGAGQIWVAAAAGTPRSVIDRTSERAPGAR